MPYGIVSGRHLSRVVAGLAVATLMATSACSDDASAPPDGEVGDTTTTTEVASASPATIAARQRFFGLDNVDADTGAVRDDRVIVSWFGLTSFAASFGGHVVLLDAYVNRFEYAMEYVGTTPEEVAALAPEAVFIGHGHGDHIGDLPTIVRANPATKVVGTGEHCADVEAELSDVGVECVDILPAPSAQAQVGEDDTIIPGVKITAVRHPHNGEVAATYTDPRDSELLLPSRDCTAPPKDPSDPPTWRAANSLTISVFYQFELGDFVLDFQNTVGANDASGVTEVFRGLPAPDVLLSPSVGLARAEILSPVEVLQPKILVPNHHDAPCGAPNKPKLEELLAEIPADSRPVLWFISDPGDFLRPMSWDPASAAWVDDDVRPEDP